MNTCSARNHRKTLLVSEYAACYCCMNEFLPVDIDARCDDGETALCPFCDLDFVVGFNGKVDREWLCVANREKFHWRYEK